MQILQWLLKLAHEQPGSNSTTTPTPTPTPSHKVNTKDQVDQSQDIIFSKHTRSSKTKKFWPFICACNKDVAKACFYSTIYLRRGSSSASHSRQQHYWAQSMNMMMMMKKKEDINAKLGLIAVHKSDTGNKVLPIISENEAAALSSSKSNSNDQRSSSIINEKKDKIVKSRGHKTKTMSRMKELLRWAAAAAAKSEKGAAGKFIGRKFRNGGGVKAEDDEHRHSNSTESPKISLRWDVESCSVSSICSAFSAIHSDVTSSSLRISTDQISYYCNIEKESLNSTPTPTHGLNRCSSRRGNWITTDSEFVVLEL